MPRKSKLKLEPLALGQESVGKRIARIRKERGYTQIELAERIGIIQALISDYERDKLRLNADMAVRFAIALETSTDELLGLKPSTKQVKKPSQRVLRRLEKIEALPTHQRNIILKTIDAYIRGQKDNG